MFKIKPHTHQRHLEGTNKTLCASGPRESNYVPIKKAKQKTKCVIQRTYWWLLDVGMGTLKDRNDMDITEAKDTKKR